MELISSQIEKVYDILSEMDEVIDSAKAMPFSGKVSVDKDSLCGIIDEMRGIVLEMRKGLPAEISQARRLLNDKDNQITEARTRAEMMLRAAEEQASQMIDEHEVVINAKQLADKILDDAKKEADDFRLGVSQYAEGILNQLHNLLQENLEAQTAKNEEIERFYINVLEELRDNQQSLPTE